ncbi:MAG: PAS domain S-box protein [Chitinophagaceae bacterium]
MSCQSRDITSTVQNRFEANQLIDASLDVFCTINEQGNFVNVRAASANHWGYLPSELIGKAYMDLVLEEDVPKTNEIAAFVQSGQDVKSFVNRYKKKDGGIAYNLWSTRWDNHTKQMYAVARDGKEIIEQEAKIQQSEERFRALVQGGADMVGILDPEGNYTYASPSVSSIHGFKQEEFIGKNGIELIHPDDVQRVEGIMQKISTENRVKLDPIRLKNSKSEWRWVEAEFTNMLDNPAVNGIVVNSRDVTEKVNALKQTEANELFNRTVLESSPDCLKVLDTEGRLQFMNFNGLCQMEIDDFTTVKNKNWWMLWGSENEALVKASLDKALTGETAQFTALCPTAKGTLKWWDVMVSPVGKPGEPVQKIISVSRDITEQKNKELENELLAQIKTSFNAENDYITAASEVCKTISKYGKLDLVEVWTANLEKSQIQLLTHYVENHQDEIFYHYSHGANAFKMSESLVGKVWSQQAPLLWDDLENNKDFVRRDAAKKIGLKAVLGIPLIFNNEAVGVLKIGTKNDANYLKKYAPLFKTLERFIGSEFNRKKLEYDLSRLFNAIPDILCLLDFEGRFLKMNKSGCDLMGYAEENILYHRFEEFVHPLDKDIFTNEVFQLTKEQTAFNFENRYITKAGEIIWLSWFCNATLNEGIIYATAKNITEEKKLRELNRQSRQLAKIGSWEVDLINETLYWSEEVHQLHETDPNSFEPDLATAINFYREDFQQSVQLNIEKSITTGEPFDFEAVLVTAKKKEVWVRAIGNAEFADGKCKRIYGSFQDINDRKESENRLLSITENLPGVVCQYLVYPDGTDSLRYVSGEAKQLWGFTANEVMKDISLMWNQIKLGGDYEDVRASVLKSIQTKTKSTIRLRYVMPTGELRTHLTNGTPIYMADGTVLFNAIILDITKELKKEELLKQASEMARIGSWEMDMIHQEGDIMYWSPLIKEILEVDDSYDTNLTGGLEFYTGESNERVKKAMAALINEGIDFDEELLLLSAKGNYRWIRAIGKSDRVENKCTKIYGSFQDIDERKKFEIKLAESENRIRTILDTEPECIKLLGPGGEVIMMNPAGLGMIEADNEEQVLGKSVLGIILPEHRAAFSNLTKKVFKGESGKLVFEIEGLKGTRRWLETHAVPMKNEQGDIISLLGVTRDITDRKKAEEKLVDSEQKYRLLVLELQLQQVHLTNAQEVAKVGSWENDLSDLKLTWSDETYRIFGTDRESFEPTYEKFLKYVHPFDRDKIDKAFVESTQAPFPSHNVIEHRIVTPSGEVKVVEERWRITTNDKGEPLQAIGICQDITERKKAEEDIKDSEEKRRLIMNGALDAIICIDTHGIITFWNPQAEVIFGWKEAEVIGQQLSELIIPEQFRSRHNAGIKHYNETGEGKVLNSLLELTAIRRSGEEFPIELTVLPIKQEGAGVFFCSFIRDITPRKKAAESILQSNERFEKVTEATNDAIWDWDLVNKTYYRSKAIERFFGKNTSKSFTTNDFWEDNFHPEDIAKVKDSIQEAIANPSTTRWEQDYRVFNEQGKTLYVTDRGVIIRNNEGKAIRMVGAMTDVSEQKQMTVQLSELNQTLQQHSLELERSNEELEQFAFVASHDLQEPLRMISSFMDQLKRKYGDQLDSKAHQYIHFATDGAKKMKQIILDLLDYSRATRLTEGKEMVDFNEVLSEFKQLRRKLISEKKATITSKDLPTLNTHKAAITQIFNCLLSNALRYSKADTPPIVEINAVEIENEWEFSIKDNGIGIESQFYDKIFLIFQRLHNKNEYAGTGIGLSIAKRHVEFLGGRIWLHSVPGEGTIFYFTTPKIK